MGILNKLQKFVRRIVLLFFGSTILAVLAYRWLPVYVTPLMVIRCVQQVGRGERIRLKHHWVPLDSMSLYMPVAVMASEDQRFLDHHGFDFKEIGKAMDDRVSGKRFRGGSTISQQTAKNVFLASELVGTQGVRSLFYCSYRTCMGQASHHGGLSQFHRNG